MATKEPTARAKSPAKRATTRTRSTTTRKQATSASRASDDLSPELRHRMVAEAAYYLAEKRGFIGGDPIADWYRAEEQIASHIGASA